MILSCSSIGWLDYRKNWGFRLIFMYQVYKQVRCQDFTVLLWTVREHKDCQRKNLGYWNVFLRILDGDLPRITKFGFLYLRR